MTWPSTWFSFRHMIVENKYACECESYVIDETTDVE